MVSSHSSHGHPLPLPPSAPTYARQGDRQLEDEIQQLQTENQWLREQYAALSERAWQTRFYHLAFEPMCVVNPDGCFLEVNPAFTSLLGYSASEMLMKPFYTFIHPEDVESSLAKARELFVQGGGDANFRNRYRTKSGEYRCFLWVSEYDPSTERIYAIARDITELHTMEQRLQEIGESIPGVIYQYRVDAYDPVGQFTYLSPGFWDLYEVDPAQGMADAKCLWRCIHPDDIDPVRAAVAHTLATQTSQWNHEFRIITPSGQVKWVQANARVRFFPNGSAVWNGLIIEISDRKAMEIALKQEQEFIHLIIENVSDAVVACDEFGHLKLFNQTARQWHGGDPRAVPSEQWSTLYDLRCGDGITPLPIDEIPLYRAFSGESVRHAQMAIAAHQQPLRHIVCHGDPIYDHQGRKIGAVAVMHDVTETRQYEAAQKKLTRNLQEAQRMAHVGNWEYTPATGKIHWSQEVFHIFGRGPSLGAPDPEESLLYYHPDDRDRFAAALNHCVDTGQSYDLELRIIHGQTGEIRYIQSRGEATLNKNKKLRRLFGVVMDITERYLARKQLEQSEAQLRQKATALESALQELQQTQNQLVQSAKMSSLGQLVAGIAHEINNPVSFIFGNLSHAKHYVDQLLQVTRACQHHAPEIIPVICQSSDLDLEELEFIASDFPKLIHSMEVGAQRIRDIVLSLRNFSRLDEAEYKAVDLHEGIDNTLLILHSRLNDRPEYGAITVHKHYGQLPLVDCFAGQINQVFMNILANAIDALDERDRSLPPSDRPGSTITVTTSVIDDHWVRICIADNGPGIPKTVQEQIFDPFFTTKAVGTGTGLGMSISYQIVTERHGGQLYFETDPTTGTRFYIEIPRYAPSPPTNDRPSA